MQAIIDQLEQHIRARYEIDEDDDDFGVDVHLFDYGFIDSIGATALLAHIEKTYQIQITNQDLMIHPMNTIEQIAAVIHLKTERS